MKVTTLLIVCAILLSCTDGQTKKNITKSDNKEFSFSVDSIQICNLKTDGLNKINPLTNFIIGDNDEVYSIIKPKMFFFEQLTFDINDNISVKVIFTTQPTDMVLDGDLKLVYIATFDKHGKQISILRLSKFESISDIYNLETAVIKGSTITKKIHSLSPERDKKYTELYEVGQNGIIEKK